jgi:hypothetical protein
MNGRLLVLLIVFRRAHHANPEAVVRLLVAQSRDPQPRPLLSRLPETSATKTTSAILSHI